MMNRTKKDDDDDDEFNLSESPAAGTPTSVSPLPLRYIDTSGPAKSNHAASQPAGLEDSDSGVLVSAHSVQ